MQRLHLYQMAILPPHAQAEIDAAFTITHASADDPLAELSSLLHPVDALLASIAGPALSAEAIARLPETIRAIATYSVGLDHIDLEAARARGIAVFNTPGTLDDAVADTAMFLMLGAMRRANEAQALIREERWTGWTSRQLIGLEAAGRTLGILGMGGVGARAALRGAAFGMHIAYTNRHARTVEGLAGEFVSDPNDLVRRADVLLLTCPSTPETRRFVNRDRLRLAKPELVVVNVGRGDLVDDEALIDALATRRIYAAGLDVFDGEPHLDPGYLTLPNVFLTPHIGSSTVEARWRMARALVDGLQQWAGGSSASNRVV